MDAALRECSGAFAFLMTVVSYCFFGLVDGVLSGGVDHVSFDLVQYLV